MNYYRSLLIILLGTLLIVTIPASAQPQVATSTSIIHVPLVALTRYNPLGFETNSGWLSSSLVKSQAAVLGANWVRLNTLSWRDAQPTETSPISFSASSFQTFERDVLAANELGLTVIAIIDDHPSWATNSTYRCAAILDEYHNAFANFVRAVVLRYSQAPYFVRYWELGNEPDVDPALVQPDYPFGCWGDMNDEYYGGERYGRMLRTVTPVIRAADPGAKVVFGGLLLARPDNRRGQTDGKPFNFLEGALRAGAGPYFDILAFHTYPTYFEQDGVDSTTIDFDIHPRTFSGDWLSWGGATVGKVEFLRTVMRRYGIDKPISLNETGLRCDPRYTISGSCEVSGPTFEQAKADFLIRSSIRAISVGVESYIWYTLQGSGWSRTGLLDGSQQPRPAFIAMKVANERLNEVRFPPQSFTGYGTGLEAYRFSGNNFALDVIWSVDATTRT
ncbi:hypothetical protein, partial [uncultured Chloroflexus sp.]|uniref:hypothetical protein n=1 Tax=uncultured Chloroflexus sp. TaxID=214040 RepID=UPI0026068854